VIDYDYKHPNRTLKEEVWRAQKRLVFATRVAKELGVELIPVRTNILHLNLDGWFFMKKWIGASMSSIAHMFSHGFNKIYIAADAHAAMIAKRTRNGTHPLLDPYYSSAHLQMEHHGHGITKFERAQIVSEWPVGLQNIFVCEGKNSGQTNCGKCEKCIKTMTMLVALRKLKDCRSFPCNDVSPELLKTLDEYDMIRWEGNIQRYKTLIPHLKRLKRDDLVKTLLQVIRSWYKKHPKHEKEAS
jgi:hypothetical protein